MAYLALLAFLALMLSPILIPLAVTLAHHARPGLRRYVASLAGSLFGELLYEYSALTKRANGMMAVRLDSRGFGVTATDRSK
jgi:hypothetical protein